ncbi:MAG: ribosomal protein S18-alanine N-acetyltransferase [Oscillospiraceae bacterium]|nr:ribosomal protein S18-alanine N-acetyltransferase [Oscillospiraceae bacterium]
MNSCRFSRLTPAHAKAMSEIEGRCFSLPWSFLACDSELNLDCAYYWGAFTGGTLVGYAGLRIAVDEGHITNIAVLPEFRRAGIARALVGLLLADNLKLYTLEVRESNAAAISLYGSFGFAALGRRKGYYDKPREDALIMVRYSPALP